MTPVYFAYVYFIYGLAFFNMGLAVVLEGGRSTDARLRHALRPLPMGALMLGYGLVDDAQIDGGARTLGAVARDVLGLSRSARSPKA